MRSLKSTLKWLYPGLKIKRWMALSLLGGMLFLLGLGIRTQALAGLKPVSVRAAEWVINHIHTGLKPLDLGTLLTVGGGLLCFGAFLKFLTVLVRAVDPDASPLGLGEMIYNRKKLQRGSKNRRHRGRNRAFDDVARIETVFREPDRDCHGRRRRRFERETDEATRYLATGRHSELPRCTRRRPKRK